MDQDHPKGHVLITGAAKRIGREIALTMAKAGWNVTIHANTSVKEADALAQEIRAMGRKAWTVQANLETRAEVEALFPSLVAQQAEPVTALVNNASLFVCDEDDPDGSRHDEINNVAPRLLTEALLAQLPPETFGSVVHFLDNTPMPEMFSAYAKSRAILRADLPLLARSYAPRLRINALAPGPSLRNPRESEAHFQRLVESTLLRLPSSPEVLANSVLFLIENPAITGQILHADSGAHLFLSDTDKKQSGS